jgi:hypothetical protein
VVYHPTGRIHEDKMRFENRVLRKAFGPNRNEVTTGWRKIHYEELHNLYLYQILLG